MSRKSLICTLQLDARESASPAGPEAAVLSCPTRKRLEEAFETLQQLDWQRTLRSSPAYGRSVEDRIVWRELLELEIQAVDEQKERLLAAAQNGAG